MPVVATCYHSLHDLPLRISLYSPHPSPDLIVAVLLRYSLFSMQIGFSK